ncbi:MAG TPA: molybdenum cofactor guanylyltransferase [Anaerolineales bacterium]
MLTVAVQAGGRSSRMGSDKALLRLDGIPLIERLLQRVSGLGEEILITTNRPQDYQYLGLRMASDPEPGAGALHGLRTALEAARGQTVLVLACDMPFVSRPLLEHMLQLAEAADLVVPRRGGEYEPLHAVYSKGCLPALEAALQRGERRMISFFPSLYLHTVEQEEIDRLDPEGLSFFNVNTPEDLRKAERILAQKHSQTSR